MRTIIKTLILSLILISCHKNCPKPGTYQMTFTGTYEFNGATSSEVGFTSISETSKDSFFIGYSKINKYGKNIIGEIGGPGNLAWAKIEGVCQKKKGKYFLTGTYKASDYGGGIINGEFEIKSN
jgi:hypothetical protein